MATSLNLCGGVKVNSLRRQFHRDPLFLAPQLRFQILDKNVKIANSCTSRVLSIKCGGGRVALDWPEPKNQRIVMKFGGSLLASAERMKEVAHLIISFPEETPIIVLSAMGKTTNKLLQAGEKAAASFDDIDASCIEEFNFIKDLHLRTVHELGLDTSVISFHLERLEQLLNGIIVVKELTLRTRDFLASFGECMSTRIFAAYINKHGGKARQYDAFSMGIITTDDFTNAKILEETYPAVAKKLHDDWLVDRAIPIVTGFLGKGKSGTITTLGRGGSDLTAIAIGKALGVQEIQVWKDVDDVLTCDPNICPDAKPVPILTFEEADELAYFDSKVLHPQSMRLAKEGGYIPIRIKNFYNPKAPGTLITKSRYMSKAVLTSIVLKRNVTMLDIVSTHMLGQFGFLAKVFATFEYLGISIDVVAISEVSISLTLDPSKLWSRELVQQELEKIAVVNPVQHGSVISLIGKNVQRWPSIQKKAFQVASANAVNVQMISQGASKVKISMIVNYDEAEQCVRALHTTFFGKGNGDPETCRIEIY